MVRGAWRSLAAHPACMHNVTECAYPGLMCRSVPLVSAHPCRRTREHAGAREPQGGGWAAYTAHPRAPRVHTVRP
jgi:hypothetical protein